MSGKKKKKEEKPLKGEELYLAQQKKWANSFTMRRGLRGASEAGLDAIAQHRANKK